MSVIAKLRDVGVSGPADIGLYVKGSDIIMFQYTFSGVVYNAAIRAGIRGWVPVDVQADADTALDSALTLIGVLGAGRIFVMSATYNMSTQHTVIDNLSIVGEGKNKTIFNVTANIKLFTCTLGAVPTFVTFMNFSVVLTNAPGDQAGSARAFYLLSGADLLFSNILVTDAWTAGGPVGTSVAYYIGSWAAAPGNITRCWMENCEADGRGVRNFSPLIAAGWEVGFVSNSRFKCRDSDVGINAAFAPAVHIYRILTVRFSHCIIEYTHNRGVVFADSSATGFYSEDVAFVVCTISENGGTAIDPNYDFDISIIGCNFINSESSPVQFQDGCSRCRVIGCKINAGQIQVDASTRAVIADNELIRAESGTGGIKVFNSFIVTIKGNQIYAATICIEIDSSSLVVIESNDLEPIAFEATGIEIFDGVYVTFMHNTIYGSSSNLIYGIIESGGCDYNIYSWNIFWTADGDDFYAAFVGLNNIVENNLGDRMRDADASMTGGIGTYFTYDRQSGQVIGISTAAVALVQGVGAGRVIYDTQYPVGWGIPRITVTLVDVNAGVTIDVVEVDDVDVLGFDWAVNVTTAIQDSVCKLDWKARPEHKMYD